MSSLVRSKSSMKKYKSQIIYFLALFLFQEIVFRLCFPIPEIENFNRINYQILDNDVVKAPDLFWENMTWQSSLDTNYTFIHQLNEYGFRDKSWKVKKTESKKRVIFIGDSFVEGVMADQEGSIPYFYQKLMGDEVEVLNAGMNGTGMKSYTKLIRDMCPLFKPDELKLVIYANDMSPDNSYMLGSSLEPRFSSAFSPRLFILLKRLLVNKKVALRWGRRSIPFLFPIPDQSNPFTNYGHILQKDVTKPVRKAMEAASLNYYMVNKLYKETKSLETPMSFLKELSFIQTICKENDVELKIYYIPTRNQITNKYLKFEKEYCLLKCKDQATLTTENFQVHARNLRDDCSKLGITFYDLSAKLREQERRVNLYWNYDEHMKAKGYQYIAQQIKEEQ